MSLGCTACGNFLAAKFYNPYRHRSTSQRTSVIINSSTPDFAEQFVGKQASEHLVSIMGVLLPVVSGQLPMGRIILARRRARAAAAGGGRLQQFNSAAEISLAHFIEWAPRRTSPKTITPSTSLSLSHVPRGRLL